jgi:DNA-binding beta-propeller fold protein YncE
VYVVLEALGRLLKLDPSNGSILASLDVGPNPRHVSVTVPVIPFTSSRFITPPLPGESTASVQTLGARRRIAVVDAATMSPTNVITLRHSDKPDFELQGRGVPNYLGAVAISPDGKSAWVPSKQDNIKRGKLRDNLDLTLREHGPCHQL